MRLSLRIALAGVLVALCATPVAAAGRDGSWASIAPPKFPEGPKAITAYVVSPRDPNVLILTNGRSVMGSTDGGRTFKALLSLSRAHLSYPTAGAVISAVALAPSDPKEIDVALSVPDRFQLDEAHVLVSTNGGSKWREADHGLTGLNGNTGALGIPRSLVIAPTDPRMVYLLLDPTGYVEQGVGVDTGQSLFASSNGGGTWIKENSNGPDVDPVGSVGFYESFLLAGIAPAGGTLPAVTDLTVDPLVSHELWLWNADQLGFLYQSTDEGATIQYTSMGGTAVDISHAKGEPDRIIAFMHGYADAFVSTDGGRTMKAYPTPDKNLDAVVHGRNWLDLFMSGSDRHVYYQPGATAPYRIPSHLTAPLRDVQASVGAGAFVAYGLSGSRLVRWTAP